MACLALVTWAGTFPTSARAQLAGTSQPAQAAGRFVDHVYRDADGEHKYVVFEPVGYTPEKQWPLVFYLHGASGRGRDGRAQLVVGLGPAVKARAEKLPFLVVFPQNENLRSRLLGGWTDGSHELARALEILDEVERNYSVDKNHECLVGVSMGAFGAWSVAAENPTRWKAVIPISGGGEPEYVPALTKVPVWAFHAADDQLVPPTRSTDLVEAINAAGGRAYASIVPSGGHNIGAAVLARDEIFEWLEHPDQTPRLDIDWSQRPAMADMTDEIPFVPGAEVAAAARIRINRDLLESLSYILSDQVPADALQGWKPGRYEQQRAGIANIDVNVGAMHYTGQLEHAWITPFDDGTLRVQLGLRNLAMTITSTQLQSRLFSAQAGPMTIYIGYVEPVWLTIDVRPEIRDRQLKLAATAVYFNIPNHNWTISRPSVNVRGLPFMEDRIADRLVDGIAEKKSTIEAELRNSVPQMLAQLESRVAGMWDRTITYRQWPMPLWQPRFKFYPEALVINEQGIELHMGATVAALAPKSPHPTLRQFPAEQQEFPQPRPNGLDVAISTRLIAAYSTLLSASDVARFHVLDLNGDALRRLGQREFWNEVLPEDRRLSEEVELNTEFILVKPFEIHTNLPAGDGIQEPLGHQLAMALPQMQMQLATRTPGQSDWVDTAIVDLQFEQNLNVGIEKTGFSGRKLQLEILPIEPPQVTARLINGTGDLNTQRIAETFQQGWSASFGQSERDGRLKDLKMGQLALRWDELGATPTHFVVRLARPGIRIYNHSNETVDYQVRGTASPWSEPLHLTPGQMHEFHPATPITYRSWGPDGEHMFTLPLGFEAQIKNNKPTGSLSLFQVPSSATSR